MLLYETALNLDEVEGTSILMSIQLQVPGCFTVAGCSGRLSDDGGGRSSLHQSDSALWKQVKLQRAIELPEHHSTLRAISTAFVPPNANEFDITV